MRKQEAQILAPDPLRPCASRRSHGGRQRALTKREPRGVFTRDDIHGDTVLDCDIVIIGPGAGRLDDGGGIIEAGFEVIVLEEGSYYSTRDFTADSSAMIRQLYRDGGATMAIGRPPILIKKAAPSVARP